MSYLVFTLFTVLAALMTIKARAIWQRVGPMAMTSYRQEIVSWQEDTGEQSDGEEAARAVR